MLTVAPYAALLGLLFVFLSVRTLRIRRRLKVPIGDGGNVELARAARAHANFAEYVPLSLLLLYLLETQTGAGSWVHLPCLALLAGRLSHAWSVSQVKEDYRFRVAGMMLTFTALLVPALWLLIAALPAVT